MLTTGPPPVISLQSPNVVKEIENACSTWGAFTLIDHGVDSTLLEQVLQTGHSFFQLPHETKEKYNLQKHGAKWRGYMPFGGERSIHGKVVDCKEGLYMGEEHADDDPHLGLPTFGCNVFPEEIPEMRSLFLTYHEKMKDLGNRIMRLLSKALGLSEDYIETHVTRHEPVILPRMFRYLPQKNFQQETAEDVQWGIGRHSDYGLWTMILTDAPGLEFQHPQSNEWHAVPFVPGAIIMNVGDVLDRLTAGRFVSAYHRARNLSTKDYRLSLPFFYDPAWDARMKTLPGETPDLDTPERAERWSNTKITCDFDGSVEYSEFLAKKVAKVFPDLVPKEVWKNLQSTSEPSTRHALVVNSPDVVVTERVLEHVKQFYQEHTEIKPSHGLQHVMAVYDHAVKAITSHKPPLSARAAMEVKLAALLHDVDDSKYFKDNINFDNARAILNKADVPKDSWEQVVEMIRLVSCSTNGNSVPEYIIESGDYHLLIPRWADRLEAVGAIGVVRCYQYNQEQKRPLSSPRSPRAQTYSEVWDNAVPERFEEYQQRGGTSSDMISHYYDKLLHVARPPKELVQNAYLEQMAEESSKELVEVCIRFGKSGTVDEEYIQEIAKKLSFSDL